MPDLTGDDVPQNCYRCRGPLPASVDDWWLSADGVYCSEACADGDTAPAAPDAPKPEAAGEYDCCIHCAPLPGQIDLHKIDPAPHRNPCTEGCNDDE